MNDTTYCINFPGKAMLGKARLGVGKTSTDWAKAVTFFNKTINQMSRQSRHTIISPANSDTSPESRCGKYTELCSERLSKMFKHEIQFQHTIESAKASVAYGFQSGLLRLGTETKRCSDVDAIVAQIIALRERLGLGQKDVDRIMGYKSNMTNITERGRRNIEATRLFLQRLERIAEM